MNKKLTIRMGKGLTIPTARGRRGEKRIQQEMQFASRLIEVSKQIGFRLSSRGWCYQLEGFRLITKAEFDSVESIINKLRKSGGLPVDFVAEEEGRKFSGIEFPTQVEPVEWLKEWLEEVLRCEEAYTPDWWQDEDYYIQMVVEKIDLKTLFEPICAEYHIPIATSKGWQSILMRAKYAKRFKAHETAGRKCVLLYCGDFDPTGLQISDTLRKNLYDLSNIRWTSGAEGYNPQDLIIDRFGLNYDFIEKNKLTWIDNLITGSKDASGRPRNLCDPKHPNHNHDYVQDYLAKYGCRKCEANALVIRPDESREFCRQAIENYLGDDATDRFEEKMQAIRDELVEFREKTGLNETIREAIDIIEEEEE